jgi:peptide/nickel transport system ATP-binding protein
MCAGHLVEVASRDDLFANPMHPYTQALLSAVPRVDPSLKLDLSALMEGRVSVPSHWPAPYTVNEHFQPQLIEAAPGHLVRASVPTEVRA